MKRKIDQTLMDWKNEPDHPPLILKGARQIGKTESITHFGKQNYASFISINFALQPQFKFIIQNGYEAHIIRKEISRVDPTLQFIPGKTLILFDEITELPDLITSLKSFKEEGLYDVICSGSLLGIQMKNISHIPAGSKREIIMYPMDFEEFLWASGYSSDIAEDLLAPMLKVQPLTPALFNSMQQRFMDYASLGGMPAVIARFLRNQTFEGVQDLQKDILDSYEDDMRKYAESLDKEKILSVWNSVPAQLAKKNKKFQISKVKKNAVNRDYFGCVEWLIDAGVIQICTCLNFPELPLKGNGDFSKYKLYMCDTGLLIRRLDEESQEDFRKNRNLGVYKGALYENIAVDALTRQNMPIHYYKRGNSTLEMDFFVRNQDELIPLEVKSKNGKSRSLRELIDSDKYSDIHHGIKLAAANIGYQNEILTLPLFCGFLLKRFLSEFKFPDKQ